MNLNVFNTLTNKKEPFEPIEAGKVGMYVCGPTVYDESHIGHARKEVIFDVIYRYLKFKGFEVRYVRNITDVDDKIIKRAEEEGAEWVTVARKYEDRFREDLDRLGVEPPTHEPRATDHIDEMIRLIERLIDEGYAYAADGSVYFSVTAFKGYGKLSGRRLEDMIAGARVEVNERKQDPLDFALWKASKPGEPSWTSPWGEGRPGWHIECSTMSQTYLGETIDIHGGGKDLIFPHHENEIAQSEASTGKPFVRVWMHNGLLSVNREKMSKSLGNYHTIKEVLERCHPEVLRTLFLSTQYRNPLDFTWSLIGEIQKQLDYFYSTLRRIGAVADPAGDGGPSETDLSAETGDDDDTPTLLAGFVQAMDDDFNTAAAMGHLFKSAGRINRALDTAGESPSHEEVSLAEAFAVDLRKAGDVLGLFHEDPEAWFRWSPPSAARAEGEAEAIGTLVEARNAARRQKDWAEADRIRDELDTRGVVLEDGPGGTTWRRKRD